MLSSEALLDRATRQALDREAGAGGRGASRIISAERLARYTPFPLEPLPGDEAPAFEAAQPAGEGSNDREGDNERDIAPSQQRVPDFDDGRRSGLAEGFRSGFEAGRAHAEAEHARLAEQAGETLATRIRMLCEALQQRFDEVERCAADEVVALALEVARQALRSSLAVRPESIIAVVQEALAHLLDDRVRMQLHLHPVDLALVRDELGVRLASMGCELVADATISAGGCRIETPRATVDATLESRWRRALAAIGRNEDGSVASTGEPPS